VVSKAVGNSVGRHRVSRRIRGAVSPLLTTLPSGTRVVVRALPGAALDAGLARHVAEAMASGLARRREGRT
jgi:ribonuclease P protein component